jgi:hypothetical protein
MSELNIGETNIQYPVIWHTENTTKGTGQNFNRKFKFKEYRYWEHKLQLKITLSILIIFTGYSPGKCQIINKTHRHKTHSHPGHSCKLKINTESQQIYKKPLKP